MIHLPSSLTHRAVPLPSERRPLKGIACFLLFTSLLILTACGRRNSSDSASEPRHFIIDTLLRTTPVKSQGLSPLCWDYAMLATIETEHLMQGDSVNLSTDYVARRFIEEQAAALYFTHSGSISLRGMLPTALRLIRTYGLTHYDAFHADSTADYNVICRRAVQITRGAMTFGQFSDKLDDYLSNEIHAAPRRVYMLGAVYTPLEFSHSVCRDDEYTALTSFTHHPFGEQFALEVPDNYYHDTFLNVPVDTMMKTIVRSISRGHPVGWEGDVSEAGFSFPDGVAELSRQLTGNVQQQRQHDFEHRLTTDDHCMAIVGLAHSRDGQKYFIMKNSWGRANPYGGLMFVSFDYVRLKTIDIVVPERNDPDQVPKEL